MDKLFPLGNMKSIVARIDERLRTRLTSDYLEVMEEEIETIMGLLKLGVPKWIADKVSGWGRPLSISSSEVGTLNRVYQNQSLKTWTGFVFGLLP